MEIITILRTDRKEI